MSATAADQRPLGIDVLTAARQRIAWLFANVPRIYVSVSGGKDSTLMLHLAGMEARRTGRRFGLLFIDWEAQYTLTIDHVRGLFAEYADVADPYWVAVPLRTTNACSMYEPEWICWEPGKRALWVRASEPGSITDPATFPFYTENMTFEEFVPAFGHWYSQGKLTACLVGIRTAESLHRWRTIMAGRKQMLEDHKWTTWMGEHLYNAYPIYDWRTEDIWRYHGKYSEHRYNALYDRMHSAGLTIHQMRICEPYGDEQRKGLWLYQVIEPQTWARVIARVAGANTGAIYAPDQGKGNALGNGAISKPAHLTWEDYAKFLLDTMPRHTAEHYRNKIAHWVHWWQNTGRAIEDELPGDTGATDKPSWRRVCKTLLKNDYWCKTLVFSPTKTSAYGKYLKIMKKRRAAWQLF